MQWSPEQISGCLKNEGYTKCVSHETISTSVPIHPNLLLIDELGFAPFSENGANLLFDVFASRYEKRINCCKHQSIV